MRTLTIQASSGFERLYGCDYSTKSIELAQQIADSKELNINFFVLDILNAKMPPEIPQKFSLILDKGTYDAIALSENSKENRVKYVNFLCSIMEPDHSVFIITSCNFTKKELFNTFQKSKFHFIDEINYPEFHFGGSSGSQVVTIALKLKKQQT